LQSTELYKKFSSFFMTLRPNYLVSKRWEKVGHQDLRSTPYKQESNLWGWFIVKQGVEPNSCRPTLATNY
jgi:hypothetical protein